MKKTILSFVTITTIILCSHHSNAQKYRVIMDTDSGSITLALFDNTPKHRDNFVKLAKENFYDGLLFHRVISGFMIQAGDPKSKNAEPNVMLGSGDVGYKITAEINDVNFHRKGALAAARDNNPNKESSGCQFYIVTGKKFTEDELKKAEERSGRKFTTEQKNVYKNEGGAPHLDGNYTVYGQVIKGIEVADKIVNAPRNRADRPNVDIKINKIKVKKKFLWFYI